MLVYDPSERITAAVALDHKWFKDTLQLNSASEEPKIDQNVIMSLKHYKGLSKLKKAALNILVKTLDLKEVDHLKQEFYKLDKDKSGLISADELTEAMKNLNMNL